MSIAFYDASVASYLQTLGGVANVLAKAEALADDGRLDLDAVVSHRLREDMLPFSFQVISVWHHSLGAIKGLKAGLFQPPPKMRGMDWAQLKGLASEAIDALQGESRAEIDALSGRPMLFKMGSTEIPFTTDSFLLSFSLPNFYFHATTTYNILRLHGVPLGKMDYLGAMRVGQ